MVSFRSRMPRCRMRCTLCATHQESQEFLDATRPLVNGCVHQRPSFFTGSSNVDY